MDESNIIIYQSEDGNTKIETRLENETVWLTLDQMAELFQKSRSTVNEHILHIYEEQELDSDTSVRKIGNSDFSTKPTNYYNLDVIISVGYRVKSHQGTKFFKTKCTGRHMDTRLPKSFTNALMPKNLTLD